MNSIRKRNKNILIGFLVVVILFYITLNFQSKFIIENNVLVKYKMGISAYIMPKKEIKIPDGVREIGEGAFKNCSEPKKISIPNSVVKINSAAFSGCKNLKEVELSENLAEIPLFCFESCENLKTVHLNKKPENIEITAFAGCSNLQYIEFPESFPLDIKYESGVIIEYY